MKVPAWIYGSPGQGKTAILVTHLSHYHEMNIDDPGVNIEEEKEEETEYLIPSINLSPASFHGTVELTRPIATRTD